MIYLRSASAVVAVLLAATTGWACPFCPTEAGSTLVGEYCSASMVLLGTFGKGDIGSKSSFDLGATEFIVEKVLKHHPYLDNKKKIKRIDDGKMVIVLPKYLQSKYDFVLFCDVYKGMLDPYRGVELSAKSQIAEYLEGAVKLKDATPAERLRYCFDYLNSPEFEVANDAYREFAKADYQDYRPMAGKLPADTIAGWLQDAKTPSYRFGLYTSLLGHCGGAEHAKLIRGLLDDPHKRKGAGIDGTFFAYILLNPDEGWEHLRKVIGNPKEAFLMRYAALRTVRVIHKERSDLLPEAELANGVALLLDHADMADFAVEELRKWKRWDMSERVLDLFNRKSHDISVVRRAILRFALQSPHPSAADFVREQRSRDRQLLLDIEELLKLEG